jgi:alkylation response protein AidB-like acyl-CoA dehydrogenase
VDFRFTPVEEAFRKEVREFLDKELPKDWPGVDPDLYHEDAFDEIHEVSMAMQKKLAAKGWLGLTWPKKYGGHEEPLWKQIILEEELTYRGSPGLDPYQFVGGMGDLLLDFGTEAQKQKYLPMMIRGEIKGATGMSEPNAGSDLANLQLKAELQGDYFILNGQKTWQSAAHKADLAPVYVRTDPDLSKKHRGISIILVEYKKTPGITMRQLEMMSGLKSFDEVFYDNVKVPKENLLGEINGGWKIMMAALGHERAYGVMLLLNIRRDIDLLIQYCKETKDEDGVPLSKNKVIRNRLAEVVILQEIARNEGYKLNYLALTGGNVVSTANHVKIMGGITTQRVAQVGMQVMGLYGQLGPVGGNWRQCDPVKDKWTRLGGRMKHLYLSTVCNTIAAGTTEVARNAAAGGLGLPREPKPAPPKK